MLTISLRLPMRYLFGCIQLFTLETLLVTIVVLCLGFFLACDSFTSLKLSLFPVEYSTLMILSLLLFYALFKCERSVHSGNTIPKYLEDSSCFACLLHDVGKQLLNGDLSLNLSKCLVWSDL